MWGKSLTTLIFLCLNLNIRHKAVYLVEIPLYRIYHLLHLCNNLEIRSIWRRLNMKHNRKHSSSRQFTKKRMILFIYLRCWVSVESCDKKKYDLSQLDDDSMVVQGLIPSPHSEKVLVSFWFQPGVLVCGICDSKLTLATCQGCTITLALWHLR